MANLNTGGKSESYRSQGRLVASAVPVFCFLNDPFRESLRRTVDRQSVDEIRWQVGGSVDGLRLLRLVESEVDFVVLVAHIWVQLSVAEGQLFFMVLNAGNYVSVVHKAVVLFVLLLSNSNKLGKPLQLK